MEFSDLETLRITGTKVHYFLVCRRKLWLFSRHITFERGHVAVEKGKLLHKQTYSGRLRKERWLGGLVRLDYTEKGMVVEIKKSRRMARAAQYQLLFYLYALKRFVEWPEGEPFPVVGEIRYPIERRKEPVELTPTAEREVERLISQIRQIEEAPTAPQVSWRRICTKCAYAEFCWG